MIYPFKLYFESDDIINWMFYCYDYYVTFTLHSSIYGLLDMLTHPMIFIPTKKEIRRWRGWLWLFSLEFFFIFCLFIVYYTKNLFHLISYTILHNFFLLKLLSKSQNDDCQNIFTFILLFFCFFLAFYWALIENSSQFYQFVYQRFFSQQ